MVSMEWCVMHLHQDQIPSLPSIHLQARTQFLSVPEEARLLLTTAPCWLIQTNAVLPVMILQKQRNQKRRMVVLALRTRSKVERRARKTKKRRRKKRRKPYLLALAISGYLDCHHQQGLQI